MNVRAGANSVTKSCRFPQQAAASLCILVGSAIAPGGFTTTPSIDSFFYCYGKKQMSYDTSPPPPLEEGDILNISEDDQDEAPVAEERSPSAELPPPPPEKPVTNAPRVGTLATAGMDEAEPWTVLLGTGSMGHLIGIVVNTQTNVPVTINVSKETRDAASQESYPLQLPAATIVARAVFGASPTADQLKMASDALVFEGGREVILLGQKLSKVVPDSRSVALNKVKFEGLDLRSSATIESMLSEGEEWSAKRRRRAILGVALLAVVIFVVRWLLKRRSKQKQLEKKKLDDENSAQPLVPT